MKILGIDQSLTGCATCVLADGGVQEIETIDMGRRGVHNEGADLLTERLKGKVEIDHETARRLFTLVNALVGKS